MTIDIQPSVDASTQNSAGANAAKNPSGTAPQTFLDLIMATRSKVPPGPEPPVLPTPGKQAEEAATEPNAKSQKLDSPQRDKKSGFNEVKGATAQLDQSVMALVAPTGANTPTALKEAVKTQQSTHSVSVQKIGQETQARKEDTKLEESTDEAIPTEEIGHAALPVDPDVPIVSIHSFHAPTSPTAAANPLADLAHTPGLMLNPAITAKLVTSADASPAPIIKPAEPLGLVASDSLSHIISIGGKEVSGEALHSPPNSKSAGPGTTLLPSGSIGISPQTGRGGSQQNGQSQSNSDPQKGSSYSEHLQKSTKVADVVAKFETYMAARPKNGVTVELAPKSLGNITFTLKTTGKKVDTQFSASSSHVREALTETRSDLSHSMAKSGYTVTGMSVGADGAGSEHDQTPSQSRPLHVSTIKTDSSRPQAASSKPVATRISAGGVDLSI